MAIIHKMFYENEPLTAEQIKELDALESRTIEFDDDCQELTASQLKQIAEHARAKRAARRQVVALRVSAATLEKAKATGRGYTGFMSRLLDLAINNPEMVKRCL